jgi:hypothetical protein
MIGYIARNSRFWGDLYATVTHLGDDYAKLRTESAFGNIPITWIARRLDELLPRDVPVSLAPRLAADDGLRQRLSEGLYPRRTDQRAPHVLDLSESAFLKSPSPLEPRTGWAMEADLERFGFELPNLVSALAALLGFGLAFTRLVQSLRPAGRLGVSTATVVLSGSAVVGGLVYAATLAQVPLPWAVCRFAGWGCLAYFGVTARSLRDPVRFPSIVRVSPEAWILVVLLALFVLRMCVLPVAGWDGRSIWLFHAKQIFFQRMLSLADLSHADWEWSHPVYPFLLPAVMAFFGGSASVFNERMAVLAVPAVWGASIALFWFFAREVLGRSTGAMLTIALFLGTEALASDVYMDGLVAVLLAVVVLSLSGRERFSVGILAAFLVSIIKVEGALAAGLILIGVALLQPRFRKRGIRTIGALLLPMALPVVHRLWLAWHHVTELQESIGIGMILGRLPGRLAAVLSGLPGLLFREAADQRVENQALLRIGLACLVISLFWLLWRTKTAGSYRPEMQSTNGGSLRRWVLCGGTMLGILAIVIVCAMPQDADWLVKYTLDRLLLHPAVFFMILPFLQRRRIGKPG